MAGAIRARLTAAAFEKMMKNAQWTRVIQRYESVTRNIQRKKPVQIQSHSNIPAEERPAGPTEFLLSISDQLGQRAMRDDSHTKRLLTLGAANPPGGFEMPKNLAQIFVEANRSIAIRIAKGELQEDQAIYPALLFVDPNRSQDDPPIAIRPGIDPLPEFSEDLKLLFAPSQLSHEFWENQLAEGRLPFNFSPSFIHHDFGHLTEYLDDPIHMAATRTYYKLARLRSERWRKDLENEQLHKSQNPFDLRRATHFDRVFVFAEFLSLPNLQKKTQIQSLWPEFFLRPRSKGGLSEAEQLIHRLSKGEQLSLLERILDADESILLRQGGALRDPYAMERMAADPIFFLPLDRALA
ncbi:MAG: hypothetical protein K2X47_08580, partial [Bdellovibrionales bacterium]|nr:hypothetical protein [Bdellovibrionales bacterium]